MAIYCYVCVQFYKLEKVCEVCGQLAMRLTVTKSTVKFVANWPHAGFFSTSKVEKNKSTNFCKLTYLVDQPSLVTLFIKHSKKRSILNHCNAGILNTTGE